MINIIRFLTVAVLFLPLFVKAQSFEDRFKSILDSVYKANQDALGILVHIESPDRKISWSAAVGFSDSSRSLVLKAGQPVLTASNTKTYVSASVLRLVEKGDFSLDDPINKLISKKHRKLLKKEGYDLNKVTLRHLLSHTSGIHDYVDDEYFDFVIHNPDYEWSREEQIKRAVQVGRPLGEPGTAFSYGDINYLLLTEIIEKETDKPFYKAVRELLKYKDLNLNSTWFRNLEPEPAETLPFAHQYAHNFKWDSYKINPSWDLFGGGGTASTIKDAALFYQYLFEGKIISNKAVLQEMSSYVLPPEKSKYCLGIYHFDFGYPLFYHGGWWGTDVNYSPETNTSIAVCTLVKEKRGEVNPFLGKKVHELLMAEPFR